MIYPALWLDNVRLSDHLKVFANEDAAETWLQENDPEGAAFDYEVLE
jgi:hypothetical protein